MRTALAAGCFLEHGCGGGVGRGVGWVGWGGDGGGGGGGVAGGGHVCCIWKERGWAMVGGLLGGKVGRVNVGCRGGGCGGGIVM